MEQKRLLRRVTERESVLFKERKKERKKEEGKSVNARPDIKSVRVRGAARHGGRTGRSV